MEFNLFKLYCSVLLSSNKQHYKVTNTTSYTTLYNQLYNTMQLTIQPAVQHYSSKLVAGFERHFLEVFRDQLGASSKSNIVSHQQNSETSPS